MKRRPVEGAFNLRGLTELRRVQDETKFLSETYMSYDE
jgi:hypothetical protein